MIGFLSNETIKLANAINFPIESGSLRKDGRVIIFSREYPGSHKSGYGLRSRIVWWLHTGKAFIGMSINIHHKNENKSDDRIENLENLSHSEHLHYHNPPNQTAVTKVCAGCNQPFIIPKWRLKDKSRGKYCGQKCFQSAPKRIKPLLSKLCEWCGSEYFVRSCVAQQRKYCSHSCSAHSRWE